MNIADGTNKKVSRRDEKEKPAARYSDRDECVHYGLHEWRQRRSKNGKKKRKEKQVLLANRQNTRSHLSKVFTEYENNRRDHLEIDDLF